MKEEKRQLAEIKAWWAKCPAKPIVCELSLLLAVVIVLGIYDLGVAFGRLLYGFLF
ncbi:MAG: hypothetical protein IJZ82_05660 [Lachnospiraceae bacterium]|nr:hypothetical protein [Lachnospiraceae bacterium]